MQKTSAPTENENWLHRYEIKNYLGWDMGINIPQYNNGYIYQVMPKQHLKFDSWKS